MDAERLFKILKDNIPVKEDLQYVLIAGPTYSLIKTGVIAYNKE